MATVSLLHPPATSDIMAGRRAPLANVPNAINSPFRNKRPRAQLGDQCETQPPTKKLIVEASHHNEENHDPREKTRVSGQQLKLDEPFAIKRSHHAVPTAFEKKLVSACEHKSTTNTITTQTRHERASKTPGDNLDNVRQWQKHYRKQFPHFVFYFESVADDVRVKAMRQIWALGAREEKFFSKNVTHVVTTRSIPPEPASTHAMDGTKDAQAKAVKPSTLSHDQRKTTQLLDAHLQRRTQTSVAPAQLSLDSRKPSTHSSDILSRARELGIKIWALEKLQRVLSTILNADISENGPTHDSRTHASTTRASARTAENPTLEVLLRNEKVIGPADRDMTVTAQDMVALKGFYVYIHDMDEKTKPAMARDYAKASSRDDWKWPQFRLSAAGRCPFVEDPHFEKRLEQQEQDRLAKEAAVAKRAQRRLRAASPSQCSRPRPRVERAALAERATNLRRSPRKHLLDDDKADLAKPLDPPKGQPLSRQSSLDVTPAYFGSTQVKLRGLPRMVGGEPVASGVQPSNITSAIRSQVVSSAAISSTAPGLNRRVGDTKEVSMLKRKVLERGTVGTSTTHPITLPSNPSSLANDMRAVINADSGRPSRAAKRKAQETLGVVNEDDETVATAGGAVPGRRTATSTLNAATANKRKKVEKEAKPGYCENCRDKFDDFDEHVLSRKHRKFALTQENWAELDSLLTLLKRPHKVA